VGRSRVRGRRWRLRLFDESLPVRGTARAITVGNHRSKMVQQLGARNSTALVQLANMEGLI
jgi:hypothetical protein